MKKRYGVLLFMVAMAVALFGCILLVRNRQTAAAQAKQIVINDQAGTNVDTDLIKLRVYAESHMKVNVSLILKGSYDRAVAAAKAKAATSNTMYAAAQASCDKKGVDSIRQSQCVAAYIAAHPSTTPQVKLPDIAVYSRQFVGPNWSFDLAGLAFIVAPILAIISVVSIVHRAVTK